MKTREQQAAAKAIPEKLHRHAVHKGEEQVTCSCGRGLFVFVRPTLIVDLRAGTADAPKPNTFIFRCASCGKNELAK